MLFRSIVMALLLLGVAAAIPLALLRASVFPASQARGALVAVLVGGGASATAFLALFSSTDPYPLQTVSAIAWIVLASALIASWTPRSPMWLGVGAVVGALTRWGDVERSDPDQILWIYVARPAIPALVVFGISAIAIVGRRSPAIVARRACEVMLASSLVLAAAQFAMQRSGDYRDWSLRSAESEPPDQSALVEWINVSTSRAAIIASLSDVVPIGAERREAVSLPTFGYPFPPYRDTRLAALRTLYQAPDCALAAREVARGVTHAVATTEEASVGALDACATRVYENASYVVYDLAKAP